MAVGGVALAFSIRRAGRSQRDYHRDFAVFWGVFTALLFAELIGSYVFLNIDSLGPAGGLLINAIQLNLNYVMVVSVARYLNSLGGLSSRRLRDAAFLIALLVAVVGVSLPWGISFAEGSWVISLRTGFWIGAVYYVGGLFYAATYAWIFVARKPGTDSGMFLVGMAVFATSGLTESIFGTVVAIRSPTIPIDAGHVMVSTIPYVVYGLFLIVQGGVEESPPASVGEADFQSDRFGFTDRERDVVRLVCAGCSNPKIAEELFISLATVKTHLYRVYQKVGVPSRLGLIRTLEAT